MAYNGQVVKRPSTRYLSAAALLSLVPLALLPIPAQKKEPSTPQRISVIRVSVNSALVPVVVRDAQGHPIGDLTKDDFQVFDRGKPISVSGFAVEKRAEIYAIKSAEPPPAAPDIDNTAPPPPVIAPKRFIIFLFDDLHLDYGELMRVQTAANKLFAEALSSADIAAVVSLSGINSGLTRDPARLQATLKKLRVQKVFRHDDHSCPNIDYYQADLIQNKHSQSALELAIADYVACAHLGSQPPNMVETMIRSAASQSLLNGENDMTIALTNIREVVRKMGTLAGQRTLILISPGFFTQTAAAMSEKSSILDLAARCNVTISSIDARGLYTTVLDASERSGSSIRDLMSGEHAQYHADQMNFNEDVMSEFADGTGGTFFHNNNDLDAGLKSLADAPEYVYLLEISLENVKHDGSYHPLKVKLDKKGFTLQSRRGYIAPKKEAPPKSAKPS